jgi:hypothetical protein
METTEVRDSVEERQGRGVKVWGKGEGVSAPDTLLVPRAVSVGARGVGVEVGVSVPTPLTVGASSGERVEVGVGAWLMVGQGDTHPLEEGVSVGRGEARGESEGWEGVGVRVPVAAEESVERGVSRGVVVPMAVPEADGEAREVRVAAKDTEPSAGEAVEHVVKVRVGPFERLPELDSVKARAVPEVTTEAVGVPLG